MKASCLRARGGPEGFASEEVPRPRPADGAVGAVLMAASTIVVAVNARFLRVSRPRESQDESKNRP